MASAREGDPTVTFEKLRPLHLIHEDARDERSDSQLLRSESRDGRLALGLSLENLQKAIRGESVMS